MKKIKIALLSLWLAVFAVPAYAQPEPQAAVSEAARQPVVKRVSGKIKGRQTADYRFYAREGAALSVGLTSRNRFAYFNLTAPDGSVVHTGSIDGNRYQNAATQTGEYTVRVYLMRNAARRNERASFVLDTEIGQLPSAHSDGLK